MTSVTTVQTALCITPPENIWEQIQAIRSLHDKAYPRWMPHINLIYPFVPEVDFEKVKQLLEVVLHRQRPFQIQFNQASLNYFQQRGDDCTYHLRPNVCTDIIELQKVIQNQLSHVQIKKKPFEAHLTLGQATKGNITTVLNEIQAKWQTIEFTVDRVYMISRENHPENLFTIKHEILLLDEPSNAMANPIKPTVFNQLGIVLSQEFVEQISRLFERTSFRPLKSFRMILADYETGPVNSEFRSKLESISKFTLEFRQDSLAFDERISQLILKPSNLNVIQQLNVLDETKYDGTIILGELRQQDFDKVNDRFMKNWSSDKYQLDIDRIHLIDPSGRFKFIFRLKPLLLS